MDHEQIINGALRQMVEVDEELLALLGSIAHWDRLAHGIDTDTSGGSCDLCELFLQERSAIDCDGCPIQRATGLSGCNGTPWVRVHKAQFRLAHPPGIPVHASAGRREMICPTPSNRRSSS